MERWRESSSTEFVLFVCWVFSKLSCVWWGGHVAWIPQEYITTNTKDAVDLGRLCLVSKNHSMHDNIGNENSTRGVETSLEE